MLSHMHLFGILWPLQDFLRLSGLFIINKQACRVPDNSVQFALTAMKNFDLVFCSTQGCSFRERPGALVHVLIILQSACYLQSNPTLKLYKKVPKQSFATFSISTKVVYATVRVRDLPHPEHVTYSKSSRKQNPSAARRRGLGPSIHRSSSGLPLGPMTGSWLICREKPKETSFHLTHPSAP